MGSRRGRHLRTDGGMALTILGVVGCVLVTVGFAIIFWPLGLIAAGGFAIFFAYTEG